MDMAPSPPSTSTMYHSPGWALETLICGTFSDDSSAMMSCLALWDKKGTECHHLLIAPARDGHSTPPPRRRGRGVSLGRGVDRRALCSQIALARRKEKAL